MGSTLRELLELALDSPRRALAEAWWWSSGGTLDSKELQDQATREVSGGDHDNCVSAIRRALASGAAENADLDALARALAPRPLAWLVALDRYAYEEVRARALQEWRFTPQLRFSESPPSESTSVVMRRRSWPLDASIAHTRQPGHLQHWLRHHWISPELVGGRRLRVCGLPHTLAHRGQMIAGTKSLRVAVASFDDGVELCWHNDGNARRAHNVSDVDLRKQALRAALEHSRAQGAELLLAPELTVTESLRHAFVDWLHEGSNGPLWLVVPGSFHEQRERQGRAATHHNTARLMDTDGRELTRHDKLVPYRWEDRGSPATEAIDAGSEVVLLETPVGHIAVAICLDHCEEGAGMVSLWEWASPDLVLVPAMDGSPRLSAYDRAAARLARTSGCWSVVANQPPEQASASETARALLRALDRPLNPVLRTSANGCDIAIYDVALGRSNPTPG